MKMELNEELTAAAAQLGDELASACAPHQAAEAVVQLQSANTWHAVIAERRKALGLNQPEFAAKCGTTQGMISSYETGKQDMTISRLAEIAAALGMEPAELLAKVS